MSMLRGLRSGALALGTMAVLAGCSSMGEDDRAMIARASQDAAAARSAAESAQRSAQEASAAARAAQEAANAAMAATERAERIFQESIRK
jgi:hypothetical protein